MGATGLHCSALKTSSLLVAHDVFLMASTACDLQLSLDRFAAECEGHLSRKPVVCTLQVGREPLPQLKEFKYLEVLFTSDGKMEREFDWRI